MTKPNKGKTIGEILIAYHRETNPVTKSVYRTMLANRLDRLEAKL